MQDTHRGVLIAQSYALAAAAAAAEHTNTMLTQF
jgi:hypothetical protein